MTRILTFRLQPGQDLSDEIQAFVDARNIQAGVVLSAVGSVTHATLRLANRATHDRFQGPFEVEGDLMPVPFAPRAYAGRSSARHRGFRPRSASRRTRGTPAACRLPLPAPVAAPDG